MPKSPLPGQPAPLPASFEAAMDELDALVERLESGQVPVDELLQGHQRAQALLTFCRDRLQAVESALLVETGGADGSAKTRPLEPADLRPAAGAGA